MTDIISKQNASSYFWGDRCESFQLLAGQSFTVKHEVMPAHTRERLHVHKNAEQFFFVLSGIASFVVDSTSFVLRAQEGLRVPPGAHHQVENQSNSPLEFLVISCPPADNDRINLEAEGL